MTTTTRVFAWIQIVLAGLAILGSLFTASTDPSAAFYEFVGGVIWLALPLVLLTSKKVETN